MRSRRYWAAAFAVHFLFVGAVSCWDIIDLVGSGRTVLPQIFVSPAGMLARAMKSISPWQLARSNPVRQTIIGYAHSSGIESPYSFFAPSVPASLRVVFEIQFPDNRVIYELPRVQSDTEGLRLAGLVDQAAANRGPWREVVLQMLAASALEKNPTAIRVRVIVDALKFPRPAEFVEGAQPSYDFVCSYDFVPHQGQQPDPNE